MAFVDRPYFVSGGSALGRRRIQTPFGAKVLSVVKSEGKVVLGASPPARRWRAVGLLPGAPAKPARPHLSTRKRVDAARHNIFRY